MSQTTPSPCSTQRAYVCGTAAVPLHYRTLPEAFADSACAFPDQFAAIDTTCGSTITYRALDARSTALARGIIAIGIQPGDRLALWSHNSIEWIALALAALKAGAILTVLNPGMGRVELEYALTKVACKALFLAAASVRKGAILNELAPELATAEPGQLAAKRLKSLRWVIGLSSTGPGILSSDDLIARGAAIDPTALDRRIEATQPDDPANIQFASGTAGFAKAATLTHLSILNNALDTTAAIGIAPGTALAMPLPLHHCFGLVVGCIGALARGATIVLCGRKPEPAEVMAMIAGHRCTALVCVPTILAGLVDFVAAGHAPAPSLKAVLAGGSGGNSALFERAARTLSLDRLIAAYGMTETGPVCFATAPDDSPDRRLYGVGRALPHVEAKIVDPRGHVVQPGAAGEICVRSYANMRGYWNDDTRTRETIDSASWLHTGDLGVIDAEGYCVIVGRVKEMVVRGGEAIYPREVEEFLYRHPAIQEAAVFGMPDPTLGEELCAWVQPRVGETLTADDLVAFCTGQIADHKIPGIWRFVAEIPMSTAGDMMKTLMRETMAKESGPTL